MPIAETARPTFSVLVVGYNSTDDIRRLLESLKRLPTSARCEILIAENGDRELEQMESLSKEFDATLVSLPNPGFGAACNRLSEIAHGEILLLANPDLRFDGDILPALAEHLRTSNIGAVGPALRDDDGSEQISWNLPMDLWWELLEAHGLQTWWRKRIIRRHRKADPHGPWKVGFATAACLAIRKNVFDKVGGFDEGFFLNSEDIELCDRIRSHGYSVILDPQIHAVHGNSRIQGRDLGKFVATRLDGKRIYLSRHYRGIRLFIARGLLIEMAAIRWFAGIVLLRGQDRSRLPGYRQFLFQSLRLRIRS